MNQSSHRARRCALDELVLLAGVLFAGLCARLPFLGLPSSDEWVHYAYMERLKAGRRSWKLLHFEVPTSVFVGIDGYPILLHLLLSFLPRTWWGMTGRLLNATYDLGTAILLYVFATLVFPQEHVAGIPISIVAVVLFLFSPLLYPSTSRLRGINARTFSLPLVTAYLIFAYMYLQVEAPDEFLPGWTWLLSMLFMGIVLFAASLFAVQVMFIFMFVLAAWYGEPILALMPLLSLLCCFPRVLQIRPMLGMHLHFKIWYMRNYKKGTSASIRTPFSAFMKFWANRRHVHYWFIYLTIQSSVAILLIGMPEIVWVLFKSPELLQEGSSPPILFGMAILSAGLVAFILTSLPYLCSLGQAERYMEYSLPFVSLIVASLLAQLPLEQGAGWLLLLLLIRIAGCALNLFQPNAGQALTNPIQVTADLAALCQWITKNSAEARILTVPVKICYVFGFLVYRGYLPMSVKYYYRLILRPGERGYEYFERDITADDGSGSEFIIARSPGEMSREYGLTHVLFEKRWIQSLPASSQYRPLAEDSSRIVYENSTYLVVQIDPEMGEYRLD